MKTKPERFICPYCGGTGKQPSKYARTEYKGEPRLCLGCGGTGFKVPAGTF